MAQEITATGVLNYAKGSIGTVGMTKSGLRVDVTGVNYERETQSIGFSANVLIGMGSVGTPGYFFIQNNDATNYVEIFDGIAGAAFLKLKPGEFAMGRFGSAVTAPAAKANVAAVTIEYLFIEA